MEPGGELRVLAGLGFDEVQYDYIRFPSDGVKRVDFGTGNDAYKRDWMNRHRKLWRIEAFNPSRPTAWGPAITSWMRG